MNNKNYRSQWAGCSNFKERREELLKAHEEFERMLADGWQVTNAKKKRPRIQKAKTPRKVVISVLGNKTTVTYQEYLNRCQGFKIVMEIF
jgi:hypothetical protein